MPTTAVTLLHGSCLDLLPTLESASVDSIVTDPPYELGFMGKTWDASGVAYNVTLWRECLRVLKPGGHLLAFGGTRTYHRMACAIEDAGFEIRDSIHWLYGSGFPKSLDVSKAIDKRGGYPHLAAEIGKALKRARVDRGVTMREADVMFCDGTTNWSWFEGRPRGQRAPTPQTFERIVEQWPELAHLKEMVDEAEREVVGSKTAGIANKDEGPRHTIGAGRAVEVDITVPATDAARQWEGWGTALKPAHEPIVVARKPLMGTVAANVLEHGAGALNIDGCRIGDEVETWPSTRAYSRCDTGSNVKVAAQNTGKMPPGRWPANVIIDEAIAEAHPEWGRFFYCSKPDRGERDSGLGAINFHPTVKPVDLMRWLVRLVTPPNGTVLDPFAGSGTTLVAARLEEFGAIGIEMTAEYLPIIEGRLAWAAQQAVQLSLFGEGGTAA